MRSKRASDAVVGDSGSSGCLMEEDGDQRAELLVRRARRKVTEQRPDVWLANAAEDAVQDGRERPFAVEDVATHHHVEHVFGCHLFPSLAPVRQGTAQSRPLWNASTPGGTRCDSLGTADAMTSRADESRPVSPSSWAMSSVLCSKVPVPTRTAGLLTLPNVRCAAAMSRSSVSRL